MNINNGDLFFVKVVEEIDSQKKVFLLASPPYKDAKKQLETIQIWYESMVTAKEKENEKSIRKLHVKHRGYIDQRQTVNVNLVAYFLSI